MYAPHLKHVTLLKENGAFGMQIAQPSDTVCRVRAFAPDSAAEKEANLLIGDAILSINGQCIQDMATTGDTEVNAEGVLKEVGGISALLLYKFYLYDVLCGCETFVCEPIQYAGSGTFVQR